MALGSTAKRLPTDAARETIPEFSGSTIIAPSGDIVTNFGPDLLQEMRQIHRRAGSAFTMVLTPIPPDRRKDFGTAILKQPEARSGPISLSGRITDFIEKDPNSPSCLNNASIYMIETELLKTIDPYRTEARLDVDNPFYDFGKQVFPALLGRLPHVTLPKDYIMWGIQYDGEWFDVGTKRDYLRVNQRFLDGLVDVPVAYQRVPWGYLGSNVSIDFSKVKIEAPAVIGNDCVIKPGATIGPYAVIGDGWVIESGARVSYSVLWERYPYFVDASTEIPISGRLGADPHVICGGVKIRDSIVTGGCLGADVAESTVDVREDGHVAVMPIDYVPSEGRA